MWSPTSQYRYSFKRGLAGWDVWAIQIAINAAGISADLAEDGVFGAATEAAARKLQHTLGNLYVDGIVGPATQAKLCTREANKVTGLPVGLLKGVCLGESGGIVPTTSAVYNNGSRDYGPLQRNMTHPLEAVMKEAYSPLLASRATGVELLRAHARYAANRAPEVAWYLAILNYNWPQAAEAIASGDDAWLDRPLAWVEAYGIPGVKTGRDWANHYVASKSVYVTNWNTTV